MAYKDLEKQKIYIHKWNNANREKCRLYQKKYKQKLRSKPEGREELNRQCRESHERLKLECLNAYGGLHCNCPSGQCFEECLEFLCIDHINKDGSKHRKEIGGSSKFYGWLRKNKFPLGFRVLCFNCNFAMGKRNGNGHCPHEKGIFV